MSLLSPPVLVGNLYIIPSQTDKLAVIMSSEDPHPTSGSCRCWQGLRSIIRCLSVSCYRTGHTLRQVREFNAAILIIILRI